MYVMHLMGYTENRKDGVKFPDGIEPNPDQLLTLLVDMVEGRKELEMFLDGKHPKPENFEQYLALYESLNFHFSEFDILYFSCQIVSI